jgi:rod shape-determining protein MreD
VNLSPHVVARLRIALLILVTVVVQTALGSDLRIAGVAPDLMVLVSICAGLTGGAEAGAWVGFWAGLVMDMFLTSTPVGLSALTYCIVGAAVGGLRATVLQEHKAVLPLAGLFGTVAAVVFFVGAGDVLGQHQLLGGGRPWLLRVITVESVWNAVLALPAGYLYAWLARGSAGADRLGAPVGSSKTAAGVVPSMGLRRGGTSAGARVTAR